MRVIVVPQKNLEKLYFTELLSWQKIVIGAHNTILNIMQKAPNDFNYLFLTF